MTATRVLVVEDSNVGGRTLVNVLEGAGYVVRWETTAASAAAAASDWGPQTILVDRHLPDGDGADLATRLRAETPARVIVLSGDAAPPGTNPNLWLRKPVTARELLDAVLGAQVGGA